MPELLRPAGDQMFDTRAWRGAVVGGDGIEPPTSTELAEHDPSRRRLLVLTRFGSAPRRWQIVRMLEAGAIRPLLGEDRKESCSGQNTSIVGKRGSPVMQSQR
jgi:hypothetical protein